MKNLYQKLLSHVSLNWEDGYMRNVTMKLLYYLLYNDSRFVYSKRQLFIAKTMSIFTIVFAFFYSLGVMTTSNAYLNTKSELELVKVDKIHKETIIEQITDKFNSLFYKGINSREWKVKKIYDESNIVIPNSLPDSILNVACATADYYGIPYSIWFRQGAKESFYFKKYSTSNKGAKYWWQVQQGTFDDYKGKLGIKQHTPITNIKVAGLILYLRYKEYGNWELALASYNAGKANVQNGQIPNFKETKDYVEFVMNK